MPKYATNATETVADIACISCRYGDQRWINSYQYLQDRTKEIRQVPANLNVEVELLTIHCHPWRPPILFWGNINRKNRTRIRYLPLHFLDTIAWVWQHLSRDPCFIENNDSRKETTKRALNNKSDIEWDHDRAKNEPATVAAEKKMATRMARSDRGYQREI